MRGDVLLSCAQCTGQPVVLIVPHGGPGLTGVRIECSNCGMSTPEIVFGGRRARRAGALGEPHKGEAVDVSWVTALHDARARCAELWNMRDGERLVVPFESC